MDSGAQLWEVESGALIQDFGEHYSNATFAPGDRLTVLRIDLFSDPISQIIEIWDAKGTTLQETIDQGSDNYIEFLLTVFMDKNTVYIPGVNGIYIIDANTEATNQIIELEYSFPLAIRNNLMANADNNYIQLVYDVDMK